MNAFELDWLGLTAPLTVVTCGGLLLLLLESFLHRPGDGPDTPGLAAPPRRAFLSTVTLIILGLATLLEVRAWDVAVTPQLIYHGMLAVDRWSIALGGLFFVAAALSVLLAGPFMREHRFEFGEFYALVLFATAGMVMLAHAADLVSVFLGIEIMSLAVYVLTGSWRHSTRSSEAAMKYFLVGAFASAVLLYGIALIYGASGTTSLIHLATLGRGTDPKVAAEVVRDPVFLIGVFLVIGGFGFKVAAVPFHMWLPDTYEGAPTPVTAFMAAGVKAAAFASLVRVFATGFARTELTFGASGWASIAALLSILTMTLGNLAALRQDNIKRLLAWSSVAHAGYLLVGVAAMGPTGAEARGPILYYLAAYTFTTIGAFGVVAWYGSRGDERLSLDDWSGMASRHPAAALAMTIFMLSLGGMPPTAGFFGKFYLFRVALSKPGLAPVVIVAVINSMVSVYYYLRVVSAMYFREVGREPTPTRATGTTAALVLSVAGTLLLGLIPGWLVEIASQAALYLPTVAR